MRYNIAHGLVTAAQNSPTARKLAGGAPWREAASVLLVSPNAPPSAQKFGETAQQATKAKPHFLVTERSKTSGSFSSILCFPGGNACAADNDSVWNERLGMGCGIDIANEISFIEKTGLLPMIYSDSYLDKPGMKSVGRLKENKDVPKAFALRLTAIRETFEETGILLCHPLDGSRYGKGIGSGSRIGVGYDANVVTIEDEEELKCWQERVRKDPKKFVELCRNFNCIPDVSALVEWNDWLTPNCFGMQRYDTIFYMAILPKTYPMKICPNEVESAGWMTADEVLKDCEERKCKMITPQIYELTRLRNSSISTIKQLMRIRLKLGIGRWCPVYIRAKDGYLSVFPGDDLYPEDYRIEVFEPIRSMELTLEELRDKSRRQHRIEYRSEFDFKIVIKNYKERVGHIYLD